MRFNNNYSLLFVYELNNNLKYEYKYFALEKKEDIKLNEIMYNVGDKICNLNKNYDSNLAYISLDLAKFEIICFNKREITTLIGFLKRLFFEKINDEKLKCWYLPTLDVCIEEEEIIKFVSLLYNVREDVDYNKKLLKFKKHI